MIKDWIKKVKRASQVTGYTASLVRRDGYLVVTIAPREGDIVILRKNGKNGMYCQEELNHHD